MTRDAEAGHTPRHAQRRGRWQALAAVLWSGFIGAMPILLVWLATAPPSSPPGLAGISTMFFAAWLCALVPAAMAALLVMPQAAHGR